MKSRYINSGVAAGISILAVLVFLSFVVTAFSAETKEPVWLTPNGKGPLVIVTVDGKSVTSEDMITSDPLVEVSILSSSTAAKVNPESIVIIVDGSSTIKKGFKLTKVSPYFYALTYRVRDLSSKMIHSLRVEAADDRGKVGFWQAFDLGVKSREIKMIGYPSVDPDPFVLADGNGMFINYKLAHEVDASIYVYDKGGELIWHKSFSADREGGKTGKNKVYWNGKTSREERIKEGIYYYRIIADVNHAKKALGKGKISVLKEWTTALKNKGVFAR